MQCVTLVSTPNELSSLPQCLIKGKFRFALIFEPQWLSSTVIPKIFVLYIKEKPLFPLPLSRCRPLASIWQRGHLALSSGVRWGGSALPDCGHLFSSTKTTGLLLWTRLGDSFLHHGPFATISVYAFIKMLISQARFVAWQSAGLWDLWRVK